MLDHAHEFAGQIHVRAFQRAARGCATSTAAGSTHRRGTALASRDPQVLSSAAETVVGAELGDAELRHGDLLAVRVQAGDDALAVHGYAGEIARRIAVLLLCRHVRRTGKLRGT